MKKLYTVLIISVFCCAQTTFGQAPNWAWVKGIVDPGTVIIANSAVDNNGNVYTTGVFYISAQFDDIVLTSSDTDYYTSFFAKQDAQGHYQWAKILATHNTNVAYAPIFLDLSNNPFLALSILADNQLSPIMIENTPVPINPTINNAVLVKYDPSGVLQFTRLYSGAELLHNVLFAADGSSYVAGNFNDVLTIGSQTYTPNGNDIYITKYDAAQNLLWAKVSADEGLTAIKKFGFDMQGNIVLDGIYSDTLELDGFSVAHYDNSSLYNHYLAKLSPSGIFIAATNLSLNNIPMWQSEFGSDGIYLKDMAVDGQVTFGTQTLEPIGTGDITLGKIDFDGNALWAKRFGTQNVTIESALLAVDSNSNPYLAFRTPAAQIEIDGAVFTNESPYGTTHLIKFGAAGNALWVKNIAGSSFNEPTSISCSSATVYLAGNASLGGNLEMDAFTIPATQSVCFSGVIGELLSTAKRNQNIVGLYPNPATSKVYTTGYKGTFVLTDITGRIIQNGEITNQQDYIDVAYLSRGTYLLVLEKSSLKIIKN